MMCVAIQKAQQSSTQLTSIHTDLTQVTEFVCMVWFQKSFIHVRKYGGLNLQPSGKTGLQITFVFRKDVCPTRSP